jgi:hypothetical protein
LGILVVSGRIILKWVLIKLDASVEWIQLAVERFQ